MNILLIILCNREIAYFKLLSKFRNNICESYLDGSRTEKIAILKKLVEEVTVEIGSNNTVGVAIVNIRITALALHD